MSRVGARRSERTQRSLFPAPVPLVFFWERFCAFFASKHFSCAIFPAAGITLWNIMTEDAELISRYAADGSEAAFAELTRRHVDLVYSAALRLVNGDVHSA